MKIGIFKSFDPRFCDNAVEACKDLGVEYEVVDILSSEWINNVSQSKCDGFFCPSTCSSQVKKNILDERYYFVNNVLNKPIFPDYLGLYIHENKRNMAAWLEITGYPHPKTRVFTDLGEAKKYLISSTYPLVFKANLGSAASKVRIIKSKNQAIKFAKKVFPKKCLGKTLDFLNIGKFYSYKIKGFKVKDLSSPQNDYLLVQDYKDVKHEWRILKIGNSYFGHQKLLKGDFASGSGLVGWAEPPKELLIMVKDICDKGNFPCMDVDVFETNSGEYFINELQSSFGSYLDSQMYINGKPGRYKFIDNKFEFEEEFFNKYGSQKLKIEYFIELLKNNK